MYVRDLSNNADTLDVRDLIERIEELRGDRDGWVLGAPDGTETPNPEGWAEDEPDDAEELAALEEFVESMRGQGGGDHEWEGDWFPVTLIRDSYFEEYAEEFAGDIGAIDPKAGWPLQHIDWKAAAEALQIDYSTSEYDGVTYWWR